MNRFWGAEVKCQGEGDKQKSHINEVLNSEMGKFNSSQTAQIMIVLYVCIK